jgi:hypothetical protein
VAAVNLWSEAHVDPRDIFGEHCCTGAETDGEKLLLYQKESIAVCESEEGKSLVTVVLSFRMRFNKETMMMFVCRGCLLNIYTRRSFLAIYRLSF